jgi:CheY-like chemotaxis protein
MLGMSLERLGHEVVVVFSGASALEQAQCASIALVDLAMPEMDGFELAERLRRSAPKLRLVAVTGFGDERNRAAAGRAGFDRYILKPVDVRELDAIVRER